MINGSHPLTGLPDAVIFASYLFFTTQRTVRKCGSCFRKEIISPAWQLVPITVIQKLRQEELKFKTGLDLKVSSRLVWTIY